MINEDSEDFYEGITVTIDEWKAIEELNDVLTVRLFQT